MTNGDWAIILYVVSAMLAVVEVIVHGMLSGGDVDDDDVTSR